MKSKMKTCKAVAKRVRITKNGKVLKRKAGQDHYNSRESGNTTRKKRRDLAVSESYTRSIKGLLPHS